MINKNEKHKKNFFKALATLFFVTSLQVNSVYSVKYPCLVIPMGAITPEGFSLREIHDIVTNKNNIYLEFLVYPKEFYESLDYNSYPPSTQFIALESKKGELLFRKALESEEKEILNDKYEIDELVKEFSQHNTIDVLNSVCARKTYFDDIDSHSPKRIDTPIATYKACGKQVEVFDKVKLDDGRSIFCSRSIFHDKNIKEFHLLKDIINKNDGKLYINEDSMKSCSIYDAESLKHLGNISVDGTLKGAYLKNEYIYLYHQTNSKDGFDRISIAPVNNLKKSVQIDIDIDFEQWMEHRALPQLIHHQNKIYTLTAHPSHNELYIAPIYPSLKAVRELIQQGDYYLYFLDIHPTKEQYKTLRELIDENQKVFERGVDEQISNKSIEEKKSGAQQNNKSHELNLNELPEEVIFNILNFLDEKDLSATSQVNKKFYDLSNDSILQLRYLKLALYAVQRKENDDKCINYLLQLLRNKDKLATEIAEYIVNKPHGFRGDRFELEDKLGTFPNKKHSARHADGDFNDLGEFKHLNFVFTKEMSHKNIRFEL